MMPMALSDGPGRMPSWLEIRQTALDAEAGGLDAVWACDHLISEPPGGEPEGLYEGWSIVAALAASTDRVTVGTLVTPVIFRNPALLAKMAATIDEISGGRLVLGVGAGTPGLEYRMYGIADDHRGTRVEEALHILAALLAGETVSLAGGYHEMREACLAPPPGRRIPLLIAGNGPRTLRLTARYAQAWNTAWYGAPDARLRASLDAMARALDDQGRDPATLHRTVGMFVVDPEHAQADPGDFDGTVDDLARSLDAYRDLGIDELIVGLWPRDDRSLERLIRAVRLSRG
jgi:alkanesulfonate monooxygenase SsuD/methylene tetrahydromethanopterin reductase-like flavin-dependent oxidoreductase (luciferase family)